MKPDIITYYDDYLSKINNNNQIIRDKIRETRFSASSAGQCSKKQWYERHHPELKQPFGKEILRLFHLGNLVGEDIDKSSNYFNEMQFYKKYSEDYIKDDELNIGGSFDLFLVDDIGIGYLYDYKTANIGSYSRIFGKNRAIDNTSGDHYRFQLGTYAYILEKNKKKYNFTKIGYIALIGYDKNRSYMSEIEVNRNYIEFAERYWTEAGPIIKNPTEPQSSATVPYNLSWDCKYCSFNQSCSNSNNKQYKGI